MSIWTHVAAIVRIDDWRLFGEDDSQKYRRFFGKECLFESPEEVWDDFESNPENYLPGGSEGTLQSVIWVNPDTGTTTAYTLSIFGDLRDHEDVDAVIDWFKKKCTDDTIWVRDACIVVRNEVHGYKSWHYESD